MAKKKHVYKTYDIISDWYDKARSRNLMEKPYLDFIINNIPVNSKVLDLGCGTGKPIAEYFIDNGYNVTGVDGSHKQIAHAKNYFPNTDFILEDMRELNLDRKFNAIIAWHSYFHLPQPDQRNMFKIFESHIEKNGILIFTSGPRSGEVWSNNGGEELYHASLSNKEYKDLATKHNFKVLKYSEEDPDCGKATIWVMQKM